MRTITAALIAESNKLATTSAWIPLLSVEVSPANILRLTPHPTAVTFDSVLYTPWAIQIEKVNQNTRGNLAELSITLSNVTREISANLETTDVRGARVTLRYVNSANVADPEALAVEERYEVLSARVKGEQFATFIVGQDRLESQVAPGGRFYRDNCRHIYKDAACGYVGSLATCDKVLEGTNGCRAHNNIPFFGGFPLMPGAIGRVA